MDVNPNAIVGAMDSLDRRVSIITTMIEACNQKHSIPNHKFVIIKERIKEINKSLDAIIEIANEYFK